jgi:tetratricopeptide (TPR) repeat protein
MSTEHLTPRKILTFCARVLKLTVLAVASFAGVRQAPAQGAGDEYDRAIADYHQAIRVNPKDGSVFAVRGVARRLKGDYEAALADFSEAFKLSPNDSYVFNAAAWFRATCPEEKYRNGDRAVASATHACKFTDWKNADCLDTLTAAYAEKGEFAEAIKWQQKAIELAGETAEKGLHERLALYRENKPYRQDPTKR